MLQLLQKIVFTYCGLINSQNNFYKLKLKAYPNRLGNERICRPVNQISITHFSGYFSSESSPKLHLFFHGISCNDFILFFSRSKLLAIGLWSMTVGLLHRRILWKMLSLQQRLRRLRPPLQLLQQPVNVKQGQSLYGKCPLTWQTRIQKPICLQIIGEMHALNKYD